MPSATAILAADLIPPAYAWGGGLVAVVLVSLPLLLRIRKGGLASELGVPVRPKHPAIPSPPPERGVPASGIQAVRARVGHRPRSFDPKIDRYLGLVPPLWLRRSRSDPLRGLYPAQDRLRRDGRVVWACVVQANQLLFSPGTDDSPASVIWSEDRYYDDQPGELIELSRQLFALKGTRPSNPELAAVAHVLTDEMDRGLRLAVPARVTGGRPVFHSSLMVVRKHLPDGYLSGRLLPVWTDPSPTGLLLMVPAAFWPPSLLPQP